MTLQELKKIVAVPENGTNPPTAKQLRESGKAVAEKKTGADSEISVYQNGYTLYRTGNHSTVFPLHKCRDYFYLDGNNIVRLPEQFFCKKEWYLRLVLEGEDRLGRNYDAKERSRNISYHAAAEDWAVMEDLADAVLESLLMRETVAEMMQVLTERQRYIVQKYYLQEETQEQISKELGISQQAVSGAISQAISSIREKYPAYQDFSRSRGRYTEGAV